jgi:hypothetical protein
MKLVPLLLGTALLAGTVAAEARTRLTPEQRLDKAVAGRIAGKPVNCIYSRDIQSTEILDGIGIVYTTNGGTVYVNRLRGSASFLDSDDILVTRTFGSQLCNIDIVQLVDRNGRFPKGSVSLGEFVPYPKPPKVRS